MLQKIIITILFIPVLASHLPAKPLAGVALITSNNARAGAIADLFERHIISILKKTEIFSTVEYGIIKKELQKFSCTSERCVLGFSKSAKFSFLVTGSVTDRNDYITVELSAYGTMPPHDSRLIADRRVKIKLKYNLTSREFSLISEEHAGKFISSALKHFKEPVYIKNSRPDTARKLSGTYSLYIAENGFTREYGKVTVRDGIITEPVDETKSPFILISHDKKAEDISEYYTNEKRKIVFKKTSLYDTFYFMLFTAPASATMPFASPVLGYSAQNDWQGLGLWAVNASPYLYGEARGFINRPSKLRSENRDITRDDMAMNYFAWYMLLAGGTPLFIDAFSHDYLNRASYFKDKYDLMGNSYTAAWLSLISNGGGHFYRGSRSWGYFYFHLNNILLYMTLREYVQPEEYNSTTGAYEKQSRNSKSAAIWGSVLAISKTVEIIHAVYSNDRIENGQEITGGFSTEPVFSFDYSGKPVYGLNFTFRY